MTSCPWPRRRAPIDRMRDWWTPPMRQSPSTTDAVDDQQQLWSTLMQGGFWLS
ncbi:hypothetical protein [Synechococcus sp. A15-24]|uniref:hypothetical protein n=1 Tax=Synechococcus sp. A15-24 TaxID=1050635 RepID=UPI0016471918|nr:hypothetical protein [Synechococcus sp. A15-24]